uniref:TAFII28 domain-containing protein n=1 Tax=Rhabditophanes sp. KR3021 TaxID=114890 RepID=A0AC35TR51_9BILA
MSDSEANLSDNLFGDISSSDEESNHSANDCQKEKVLMGASRTDTTPNIEERITLKRDAASLHPSASMPNFESMDLSQDGLTKPTHTVKRARLPSTHVHTEDIFDALDKLEDFNSRDVPEPKLNDHQVNGNKMHKSATFAGNIDGMDLFEGLDDAGPSFTGSIVMPTSFEGMVDEDFGFGTSKVLLAEEELDKPGPSTLNKPPREGYEDSLGSENEEIEAPIGKLSDEDDLIRLKLQLLVANFDKVQMERFEIYRRANFPRTIVRKIILETTRCAVNDTVAISIAGMAKVFVGELIEEALDIQKSLKDNQESLLPRHLELAYDSLQNQGKLFGCKSFRKNPFS